MADTLEPTAGDSSEPIVSPGRRMFFPATWQSVGEALQLSPRELQITQAVFDDRAESTIAVDLGMSVHTVHTYLKRLYQKLGARSRVELVCIVVAAERQNTRYETTEHDGQRRVMD